MGGSFVSVFYLNTPGRLMGGRGGSLLLSSGYFTCNIFYLDKVYRAIFYNLIIFYMLQ